MKKMTLMLTSLFLLAGCTAANTASTETQSSETETPVTEQTADTEETAAQIGAYAETTDRTEYNDEGDGSHAIYSDGETSEYTGIKVTKSGDSDGDEADFYGENAAILAENGANMTITDAVIETDGKHANAVFSYGEGTTLTISDSTIHTANNNSGGLMTTGGATMNANNLYVLTEGNSSAAIRSDRGGGIVTVNGGYYEAGGKGSPAIYSTADITVNDAELVSTSAQGVVVEGSNSVTLNNVILTADNTSKNSDKSDLYQAVMLYQSMSGDASEGNAVFTMNGGSLTNKNGSVFFVTNTTATINLNNVAFTYSDNGDFLNIEAAGWGKDGKNGGNVVLNAENQTFAGNITVDSISSLVMNLKDGSAYTGAISSDGEVNVTISSDSKWVLSEDSYITSLDADPSSIDLNGHTLYINGEAYQK